MALHGGSASSASGGGVAFPATQVPSADPNTLDDYEEAAYTPTITPGSGSFTTLGAITGSYTKIGRMVTVTVGIVITTNGTAAGSVKATLPFASKATDVFVGAGKIGTTGETITGTILPATSIVEIYKSGNIYPGGDGARIDVTVTYFV